MSCIFLSYRRDDSAGHTGRLVDWLAERFGQDLLFRDLETIEPGEDFVKAIQGAIANCAVMIAVIGKQWASCTDDKGRRRLDNAEDFVRFEIKEGLSRNIVVLPVLVHGASMPKLAEMPDDLKQLARLNAIEVSDKRWDYDIDLLGNKVEQTSGIRSRARRANAQSEGASSNVSIGKGALIENSTIGTIGGIIIRGNGLIRISASKVDLLEGARIKGSKISAIIGFKTEG